MSTAAVGCALLLPGCGNTLADPTTNATLFVADCSNSGEPAQASDVVVLDWTGGNSDIFPDLDLPELDLSAFATLDGGTLADDVEGFRETVRSQVARTLCDFPDVAVAVRTGEGPSETPVSTVYVAHLESPRYHGQIGEGHYDVCNIEHDNEAVLFGREFLYLGGPYTVDEWAVMFANVIAHEIGHMVGYGHVERGDSADAEHSLFAELMLASHTLDELLSEQRFLSPQTNCPEDTARQRRAEDPGPFLCGPVRAE